MAFRLDELLFPGQVPQDWNAGGGLYLGLAEFQVAVTAHAVQNHSGHVQVRIEFLETQHLGRHAAGDFGSVDYEDYGSAQQFSQLGG